jgi:hypothetical protein
MPSNNYAGKPFPRHYAPAAPRIFPDGTQSISAYTAPLAFYDPVLEGYSFVLGNRDKGEQYDLLLFGSDYPAIVTGYATYEDCVQSDGTPIVPSTITQNCGYDGYTGGSVSYYSGFSSAESVISKYGQIINGTTVTNGVKISGFAGQVSVLFNNVYKNVNESIVVSPHVVTLNAIMNGVSAAASSMFAEVDFSTFQVHFRLPIILWEPDFTQSIKNSQMAFESVFVNPGFDPIPTTFDVVGIWSGTAPYAPPAAPSPFRAPLEPETPARALPRFPWTRP